jgi:hypothetical protein
VSTLLGSSTAVYFNFVPRQATVPLVVIHRVSSVPIVTLDATAELLPTRFQFDSYAADSLKSRQLAAAVYNLLKDYAGVLPDGTVVQGCVANNGFDMPFEQGAKDVIFRAVLDITIWSK